MKLNYKLISALLLCSIATYSQSNTDKTFFDGNKLFSTVEKFVSLGEHRTGTPTDFATSEWLGKELSTAGYEVKYYEFQLKQFFLESATVSDQKKNSYKAFPLWYVSDSVKLNIFGVVTSHSADLGDVRDKIVLLNFSTGQGGEGGAKILQKLNELIDAGALGIIGYSENAAGEIAAINAPKAAKPWSVPIVLVSQSDAKNLVQKEGQTINVSIKGTFKNVTARNVYGKIGNGDQYIVVSTPISGWFTCGGERGPGIATWLALARWAALQKLPYTFIFTGNSGHELGGWGAKAFLDGGAPPVDKTKLWVHLGAGIATLSWKSTPSGLVRENTVDVNRNFFYSASVKSSFEPSFKKLAGNKWEIKQKAGGELIYVIDKGYTNVAGAAYSHPYFHMKSDDATKTSPEILEEVAIAFKNFIELEINNTAVVKN
jgi:hypothetical protein